MGQAPCGTEENSGPGNFVVVAWPYKNLSSQLSLSHLLPTACLSFLILPVFILSHSSLMGKPQLQPRKIKEPILTITKCIINDFSLPGGICGHAWTQKFFSISLAVTTLPFWCVWNSIDIVGKEKCCPLQGVWISGSSRLSFISIFLSYGLFILVFDFEVNAAGDSLVD